MRLSELIHRITRLLRRLIRLLNSSDSEKQQLLLGRLLSEQLKEKTAIKDFSEVEFSVFSQWGEDGILQWLLLHLDFPNQTFIEFGVEDYRESNTRFLMMNNNWSGQVIDASNSNIEAIKHSEYFWQFDLQATQAFIDQDNINELLQASGFGHEIGILSIDLDGMDYWIWQAIRTVSPVLVIVEYNSVLGNDRAITVPYQPDFSRSKAHYSHLFFGASLPAFRHLALEKSYTFIGSNSAGNNAFFVRNDCVTDSLPRPDKHKGYVASKFRESRDRNGQLNFISSIDRLAAIKGLTVYNVVTETLEKL